MSTVATIIRRVEPRVEKSKKPSMWYPSARPTRRRATAPSSTHRMTHLSTTRHEMATKSRQSMMTANRGATSVESVTCKPSRREKPIMPKQSKTKTVLVSVRSFCGCLMVPPSWRSSRRVTMCRNVGVNAAATLPESGSCQALCISVRSL
jgi:hypothetical protein